MTLESGTRVTCRYRAVVVRAVRIPEYVFDNPVRAHSHFR